MHDLVIRNGNVIDGTGAPARQVDVAIDGDRIVAVGKAVGRGTREIDARGLLVTPGFVDFHTHYDGQVSWDSFLTPSSLHGCTTVVMGNCGVGFAPAAPDRHDWLIALMEGVEDIPGAALTEGITWGWESFPEYLDVIDSLPHVIDFGTQIPHGALRAYVMGERANDQDATAADIQAMYRIVKEALEVGALGFSTSRTLLHKSIDGIPVPGTFAARDELFGIGKALRDTKRGVYGLAIEHLQVPKEMGWMEELAADTNRPVIFNFTQTDFKPKLYTKLLGMLDEARAKGVPLYGQCAGRAIGIMMNFAITAHPFARHPSFMALEGKTYDEKLAVLRDPEFKRRLMDEKPVFENPFEALIAKGWGKMFVTDPEMDYEPTPDKSIKAIAKATGRRPQELAYEAMMADDGKGFLYFPLFNYANGNLDCLHTMHSHPQTRMGLSDGGAHCGAVCDGGMPTFMLTHWTRDRARGERLPLEYVIQRQTSQSAHTYGLYDRGVLAPGYKADVNIIDYDRLTLERPEVVYDLPGGGRRLLQKARGYEYTVCSGTVIREKDAFTGDLPGRLVRGAQAKPAAQKAVA